MSLFKKIFLYFPILLGVSMILAFPVGMIFTKAQYGVGILESVGNTMDYFFNGTKLSYMLLMWPLGVLLELPMFLVILFPAIIIALKIKFIGTIGNDQIIASILGIIFAIIIFKMKKKGRFNWFTKTSTATNNVQNEGNHVPEFITNFSILAWTVLLTFFLSYITGHYVLPHISNFFKYSGGGFFSFPQEFVEYVSGIPVTYAFFLAVMFGLYGKNRAWNSHLIALSPALILSALGGAEWFFITIAFFVVGIIIAKLINKIPTKYNIIIFK